MGLIGRYQRPTVPKICTDGSGYVFVMKNTFYESSITGFGHWKHGNQSLWSFVTRPPVIHSTM
jgi:hypothetical protein